MVDGPDKPKAPPPRIRIGALTTASRVRCAFQRLANAVLRGQIRPEQSNAAAYCIAGASKALELELLERGMKELARRNDLQEKALRYYDAEVVGATPGVPVPVNGHTERGSSESEAA